MRLDALGALDCDASREQRTTGFVVMVAPIPTRGFEPDRPR